MSKITDYFPRHKCTSKYTLKNSIKHYFPTNNMDNQNRNTPSISNRDSPSISKRDPTIQSKSSNEFSNVLFSSNNIIYVYTDGSCLHNGSKHAKAGIGIYFGENDPRNVSRRIEGKQTNNTAELKAILEVFRILNEEIHQKHRIDIYTDSQYSIWCCGSYGRRMRNQNYQDKNKKSGKIQDIPNKLLVKQAVELFSASPNVRLVKIEAHTGKQDKHSLGNEQADKLAYQSISDGTPQKPSGKRKYIFVPYHLKDTVKQEGAKWDYKKKKWYYMDTLSTERQRKIHTLLLNKSN